ncbi:hypothetical protein ACIQWZ_34725 [Streptomyces sp. NPDC098077]|uniref:hypothetical protein n=1 Tax=Streptomyces sp. NPDC098077 TaxID=3366093 RepID=UPI0038228EC1
MTGSAVSAVHRPAVSAVHRSAVSVVHRSAPSAVTGSALLPHQHVFRTEESQP